jgi:hypothetical protein
MPTKKSKKRRSVSDRISDAAARVVDGDDYQQFQDYNHGRSDVPPFEYERIEQVEISEGTGTLFDVPESNLDDGSQTPPPAQPPDTHPKAANRKPREIGLEALGEWTDKQPWYIWAPMMQFVVAPLYALRFLFWFVLFGFVLYFMSGGGAP